MIHRAPFGSLERMIGLLTEQYAGAFPFWFSPVQIAVLPIADRHFEKAVEIAADLRERLSGFGGADQTLKFRRHFLKQSAALAGLALQGSWLVLRHAADELRQPVPVAAHR